MRTVAVPITCVFRRFYNIRSERVVYYLHWIDSAVAGNGCFAGKHLLRLPQLLFRLANRYGDFVTPSLCAHGRNLPVRRRRNGVFDFPLAAFDPITPGLISSGTELVVSLTPPDFRVPTARRYLDAFYPLLSRIHPPPFEPITVRYRRRRRCENHA